MDEELKKALEGVRDDMKLAITAEVKAALTGAITKEDLTKSLEEAGVKADTLKTLTDAVEKQGEVIREMKEKGEKRIVKTIGEILKEKHEEIIKALDGPGGKANLKVNKTTVGLTSITSDPMGIFEPGFARIASQQLSIIPSLAQRPLGPDSHGVIYWTDQTTRTNNAAARSDGSAAAEQVYAWTGYSETVDNISAAIPVHLEALKHISQMEGELKGLLEDDVRVAAEGYAYTGNGTAPQIGGLYTRATAFVPATYIAAGGYTPVNADLYDLILAMSAQIMKGSKYVVDTCWINPYTALMLKSAKDIQGRRDIPPMLTIDPSGQMRIGNVRLVESNSVTANTMVVGDSRKAKVYFGDNIELTMGYNTSGDFTKRIITILANMELSLLIRNAEVNAFLSSSDVINDIAGITSPSA